MSATATATAHRTIEIEPRVKAFYELTGNLDFRLYNAQGDFITANSNWNGQPNMTDEEIAAFYTDNQSLIAVDFNEALRS